MFGPLTACEAFRKRRLCATFCGGLRARCARSVRSLLFLFRSLRVVPCIAGILHFCIAVAGATIMVGIEFFPNLRFRLGLEILINALVVLVGTTAIRDTSIVTRGKVVVLESGCKNCS
jgi:hypothetical protein